MSAIHSRCRNSLTHGGGAIAGSWQLYESLLVFDTDKTGTLNSQETSTFFCEVHAELVDEVPEATRSQFFGKARPRNPKCVPKDGYQAPVPVAQRQCPAMMTSWNHNVGEQPLRATQATREGTYTDTCGPLYVTASDSSRVVIRRDDVWCGV